ncbi:MAG: single-stranded DNA-binding protein [Phycisphaerae bacterium]|nr:single-stranded DNA-binding protein [Phycisphaerae bacterium]
MPNKFALAETTGPGSRSIGESLISISRNLAARTGSLKFGSPVTHVYRPLDYARALHEQYLLRYANRGVKAILLGMNPGPWGMAQTGVPFGEVRSVREWLRLDGQLVRPRNEHPKRPVQGLSCLRNEVSGARLWGWAAQRFKQPAEFFRRYFVANYCPLCFLESTGRNRTPDKLSPAERESLFAVCDAALKATVELLQPQWVIGVGTFAESRARSALAETDVRIGRIPHPSPASPAANRGWSAAAEGALRTLGLEPS